MIPVKVLRVISKTLSTLLLAVVVLLAVLLGGVRLIGLTPYTVLSGSMEPTYHVGSVIYVTDVDPAELKAGDPITYTISGGVVVTHRIESVENENTPSLAFRTKGDANDTPDSAPIPAAAVIGKPIFSIPYLGYVSEAIRNPAGLILIVVVCIAILILSMVVDSILVKPAPSADPLAGDVGPPETPPEESL